MSLWIIHNIIHINIQAESPGPFRKSQQSPPTGPNYPSQITPTDSHKELPHPGEAVYGHTGNSSQVHWLEATRGDSRRVTDFLISGGGQSSTVKAEIRSFAVEKVVKKW